MLQRLLTPLATASAVGMRSSFAGSTKQLMGPAPRLVLPQRRELLASPVCMGRCALVGLCYQQNL